MTNVRLLSMVLISLLLSVCVIWNAEGPWESWVSQGPSFHLHHFCLERDQSVLCKEQATKLWQTQRNRVLEKAAQLFSCSCSMFLLKMMYRLQRDLLSLYYLIQNQQNMILFQTTTKICGHPYLILAGLSGCLTCRHR